MWLSIDDVIQHAKELNPVDLDLPRYAVPEFSAEEWRLRLAMYNQEKELQAQIQRELRRSNHQVLYGIENLSHIPKLYYALFYRARALSEGVRHRVATSSSAGNWANEACLLVNWAVNELRDEKMCVEQFLNSQRNSIYWILDDALLHILVDQWEDDTALVPWDKSTVLIRLVLSEAESLMPEWAGREFYELCKWGSKFSRKAFIETSDQVFFRESRNFLRESMRIHEVWRTVNLGGRWRLPAELAREIVEDVLKFEGLPTQNLRTVYFPRGKGKIIRSLQLTGT